MKHFQILCYLSVVSLLPIVGVPSSTAAGRPSVNTIAIFNEIGLREYDINWQETVGAYQAPNRANNFRVTFLPDGVLLVPRDTRDPADNWKVVFRVTSLSQFEPVVWEASSFSVSEATAHVSAPNILCEYKNEVEGLHQSFLVSHRPILGSLTITLAVQVEGLWMQASDMADAVQFFKTGSNEEALSYEGLYAFDALGQQLPAHMEVNGSQIDLVVDDSEATYPVLVDPWDKRHTYAGTQGGAKLGFSLAFLDVYRNAPPLVPQGFYGSLAVGAPWFDDGLTDQGKVFVYFGGPTGLPTNAPSWACKGDTAYGKFGNAVIGSEKLQEEREGALTLNNDDRADLIVGQPDDGFCHLGKVLVWYGPAAGELGTSNRTADVVLTSGFSCGPGCSGYQSFGWSLATGDVTGDLIHDLIVGAPTSAVVADEACDHGAIHLFKGSTSGIQGTTPAQTIHGNGSEQLGFSLSAADDPNADGFKDVLVGAPYANSSKGKVYLFNGGSSSLSTTAYWSSSGDAQPGARFGYSVKGALDLDSPYDVKRDLVVGAPYFDGTYIDQGRVYVFRNYSGGTFTNQSTLDPPAPTLNARMGWSVTGGHVGDAAIEADIIVGSPLYGTGSKGRVFVYFGIANNSPNPIPDVLDSREDAMTGEHFGSSVVFLPKILGSDPCIAGGAPEANPSGVANAGLAVVFQYSQ